MGTVIWVVGFSLSSLWVCPAIPFWPEEFLLKGQLLSLWESPCVICCFSLAAFNICSLRLFFINFINMCLGVLPWVYPVWDSLGLLDLGGYFLPHFREVFKCYLLKYFLMTFLFVFFWDSYDLNVGAFTIVPEVSEVVLISSILFSSLFPLFTPFYLSLHLSYLLSHLFYCWFPPEWFWIQLLHYSLLIGSFLFL